MKIKKIFYLICSTVLGIIFSLIIIEAVEIIYIQIADRIIWYYYFETISCALHPVVVYGMGFIGIIGGFFVGQLWWRMVYIEKRHWRLKK